MTEITHCRHSNNLTCTHGFITSCLPAAFSAFLPACQKNSLLMVRKHGNYLKAVAKKKARMGMLLIQADSH